MFTTQGKVLIMRDISKIKLKYNNNKQGRFNIINIICMYAEELSQSKILLGDMYKD